MKEDGGEEVEEGGEGRGEQGRVAKVTKDPQVRTLQQFVRAENQKSQATPAQKSQVTPDRSHKRPLYRTKPKRASSRQVCIRSIARDTSNLKCSFDSARDWQVAVIAYV